MKLTNIICNTNKLELTSSSVETNSTISEYLFDFRYNESIQGNLNALQQFPMKNRPLVHLHLEAPALYIVGIWRPDSAFEKNLIGDWAKLHQINLSHSAPVVTFFNQEENNCFTVSSSNVNQDSFLLAGVHEETGEIYIDIIIYLSPETNIYDLTCRIDTTNAPLHQVLENVSNWWDSILPDKPMCVPRETKLPMYSTWYSYHQDMTDELLRCEYQQAANLGMKTVIIDDGWQTEDNNRGYGFCGDWKSERTKFPDLKKHVDYIHSLGMKCLLWYSVAFVGKYSSVWNEYSNMLLHFDSTLQAGVLDPRYPQVRFYLITLYKTALEEWNLDGLKLDFIDSFREYTDTPEYNRDMDFHEIQDAVYHLMLEISKTLRAIKPNIMIEFRQNYIGPQMRRFGNIFRVGDCPLSSVSNRIGITDLKLISGNTAIHSDMIMWHHNESPEDIAIRLINCIFGNLQISVKLNSLNDKQYKVLQHYLKFSISNCKVLQEGIFSIQSPLALYPVLQSCYDKICIIAYYISNVLIKLPFNESFNEYWILNGCKEKQICIQFSESGTYQITSLDCFGDEICRKEEKITPGLYSFLNSAGGSMQINKIF
ncbi:glycoside hydrolase family 36 protein [Anaerocolumna sp. MB42-C2]|uniref:glycoside hydrolase family 36 protein n=1 Tax=Anaerocolumna sp. MB42-C2 TaxID=3070997 RepID=UPI0027E10DCF|nr:glycoside hydrolase family 36 protein [Anaerocolumna sp. MB42-C2]WMJ90419.1 alpha-galactosidase [Anaerocolumna sp. MB42-C2]